jgi:hypothetical protein
MLKATYGLRVMIILFALVLFWLFNSDGWSMDKKAYQNI